MRQVELIPGISSSVLGFGCAPVLGARDSRTAKIAIHTALDVGINHFDLARSYGYGEAEQFVGKILASRRDQVRIATKFGIYANWKSQLLRPLKPIYRKLRRGRKPSANLPQSDSPSVVSSASNSDFFHSRLKICPKNMLLSLDKSLRALQTDYVDYLFVHEPVEELKDIEILVEAATKLKQHGKIRAFGLATRDWDDTFAKSYGIYFDLLQFAKPESRSMSTMIDGRRDSPSVIYSVFRGADGRSQVLKELSSQLNKSILLCSMFNPKHIELNTAQIN